MVKPRGSKFKKQDGKRKKGEKRPHPRGGGFGFDKTRELKELLGDPSSSKQSPIRSTLHDHNSEEEGTLFLFSYSIQRDQLKFIY